MSKDKAILRSRDVAHILDCSPDDVIDLARKGKLVGRKKGRLWRFREEDIKTYVKRQKRENKKQKRENSA